MITSERSYDPDNDNFTLLDRLAAYSETDMLPMHMPGHKRKETFDYLKTLNAHLDITEITGFDDLHSPTGILKEGMEIAAKLYGCDRAYYLVNGTTAGILSGIKAVCGLKDEIMIAANCHKSVYHAIELLGLKAHIFYPEKTRDDICNSISPDIVTKALEKYPESRMVVITSPTYDGIVSDIESIAETVHRHGKVLMVDAAHGAHFGLEKFFPENPIRYADLVTLSLHKTMPSLTQTALLLCSGDRVDTTAIEGALNIFQTSSPSYLLMASIDSVVRLMTERSGEVFEPYINGIKIFYEKMSKLKNLRLLKKETVTAFDRDEGRIVVLTDGTDIDGFTLSDRLRDEYGIESEMSLKTYVIYLTGLMDDEVTLTRLADALMDVDKKITKFTDARPDAEKRIMVLADSQPDVGERISGSFSEPETAMDIYEALRNERETVPIEDSIGRIAAEYIWAYPPGIPIVFPGCRITAGQTDEINKNVGRKNISVIREVRR